MGRKRKRGVERGRGEERQISGIGGGRERKKQGGRAETNSALAHHGKNAFITFLCKLSKVKSNDIDC